MKKIRLLFLNLFILAGWVTNAQTISGIVSDKTANQPLTGATVQIVNSLKGVITTQGGNYSLLVPANKKVMLKAAFVGYKPQIKEISLEEGENIEIDFELHSTVFEQEEVIVTGTRVSTSRSNIPLTTSVIPEAEIESSSEINIMPLLGNTTPGVFVTERGITGFGVAEGAAGKVSVRGVGSGDQSRLLIMIDGQPQVMGIFGHAFPDMYQTSNIEKVEIIRGPGSLLYGSNAMGGVINMITKKQKTDGFTGRISASAGSFATLRGTATAGYRKKNFSVYAAYNHDQTNGARENSKFNGDNGYLALGYQIGSHFELNWTSNYSKFYAVDPGPINTSTPELYTNNGAWADIARVNSIITLNNTFGNMNGHVKFYYNQGEHELYTDWVSTDRNYGVSLFEGLTLFTDNLIGVGLDWNQYGGIGSPVAVPKMIDGEVQWGPSEYNNKWIDVNEKAAYIFVQQGLWSTLTLNGGIRYNHHSLYGANWIPQLGLTLNANNNEFKALASKGFRSPNVKDLYFFPPANPNLQPESMWNYELGYTRYALDKKLKISATVFYINGENLVQAMPNPNGGIPPMVNQNTGTFENYGAELDASYRVSPALLASATYSYLHTDAPRIASPKHQATANVHYLLGKFTFNVSAQAVAGLYTLTDNKTTPDVTEEEIQNYFLLNAKINYKLLPSLNLFVSADNLLNAEYSAVYGYPMPGITFFGGLNFSIN
jgi:iron complex outermembrane receptor protein